MVGAALLVWSADAGAHVEMPFAQKALAPWWAHSDLPDIASVLPMLGDLEPTFSTPPSAESALPCGLFLGEEPRLTLFEDPAWWEPSTPAIVSAWHTERSGEIVTYDQIPRRWSRPSDYAAYSYPVVTYPGWVGVTSGYDLDLDDDDQRRGTMRAIGHGGVDLPRPIGTKISMIGLDRQLGDAKVVYVGTLFGNSVVTLHVVREGAEKAHYVVVFGHLDHPAAGLERGRMLRAGDLVGFVGDSGSPDLPHLHLEARRIRDGVDPATLTGYQLIARDVTVVTDPRNVLPTRPLPRSPSCAERRGAARRAATWSDMRLTLDGG